MSGMMALHGTYIDKQPLLKSGLYRTDKLKLGIYPRTLIQTFERFVECNNRDPGPSSRPEIQLVYCYECGSYMELRRVADVHGGNAVCDECDGAIEGEFLWHCHKCCSRHVEDENGEIGYDLCTECGLACSRGIKEHQDDDPCASPSVPQLEVVLNGDPLPQSAGADSAADVQQQNSEDTVTRMIFIGSSSGRNNYQFAADTAEALAETLRARGCIVDPSAIQNVDRNGLHFGAYRIYCQKLKLDKADMKRLQILDKSIRTATIINDADRLAELQVDRSEFMYELATTQHAQKERAQFSSMGFSSEEMANLKSLALTPLSMREIRTHNSQVGEEVAKAAMVLWAQKAQSAGVLFRILHCGTYNHWVLAIFRQSQPQRVIYYDSCGGTPNDHVKAAIKQVFADKVQLSGEGKIRVVIAPSQRQTAGSNLCLFFSVANADFFIHNRNSRSWGPSYDESHMRSHLEKCLSSKATARFPLRQEIRLPNDLPKSIYI